jgi:zinc transporter, ZIP family
VKKVWLLGLTLGLLAAAGVILLARPWQASAGLDELSVEQTTLRPGAIILVLTNGSEEVARVAQVIVNDAYVDFRTSQPSVRPDDAARIAISYPWIEGEAYDIELLMSPGGAVEYEIEEAETGTQSAEAA